MKTDAKITLAVLLAQRTWPEHTPGQILESVKTLSRLAARAETVATAYCNGDIDSRTYDKKITAVHLAASRTLNPYQLRPQTSGDPRGYCLRLFAKEGTGEFPYNTFGGKEDGYGI